MYFSSSHSRVFDHMSVTLPAPPPPPHTQSDSSQVSGYFPTVSGRSDAVPALIPLRVLDSPPLLSSLHLCG